MDLTDTFPNYKYELEKITLINPQTSQMGLLTEHITLGDNEQEERKRNQL